MNVAPTFQPGKDWLDAAGALELARIIEGWWAKRGFEVAARIEPTGMRRHRVDGSVYAVRSNLDARALPADFRAGDLSKLFWYGAK